MEIENICNRASPLRHCEEWRLELGWRQGCSQMVQVRTNREARLRIYHPMHTIYDDDEEDDESCLDAYV